MRKKKMILLVVCLLVISIMIGGCISMEPKMPTAVAKFPDKPITLIVPFAAGGGLDLVARGAGKGGAEIFRTAVDCCQ